MKKTVFLLIISIFSFCSLSVSQETATLSIQPATEDVSLGDVFDLTAEIANVEDIVGYQFDVSYDPKILEVISVQNDGSIFGWSFCLIVRREPGLIHGIICVKMGEGPGASGNFTLATITFKAIDGGQSEIDFPAVLLLDSGNNEIPYQTSKGNVDVSCSVLVNEPTSVSTWVKGQNAEIDWASCSSVSSVNIYLYKETSPTRTNIALGTANDHTHIWKVPLSGLEDGTDYFVRIEDAANASDYGLSPQFSIKKNATLNLPAPVGPPDKSTDQFTSVSLQWQDTNIAPQETAYQVRIKKAGGTYSLIKTTQDSTSYMASGLSTKTTYYWNVRAKGNGTTIKDSAWANSGLDWSFTTGGKAKLNAPVLVDPPNGTLGVITDVNLQWQDTNSGPEELGYKIRIKQKGQAYVFINAGKNAFSYLKSGLLPDKTYYWNVQAIGDGRGILDSDWANAGVDWSFTTRSVTVLNAPILVAPADGSVGEPTTVTFQWLDTNSIPQERGYKIRLKPKGGAYVFFNRPQDATSYLKSGLIRNKTYYWNVRAAGNAKGTLNSEWANGGLDWKFSTGGQ